MGRFLILMAVAGVIAAYGVFYSNSILVVGAMAVSPDFLPLAATCIGLVARRRRLVGRAFWTLTAGLGTAGVVATLLTVALDALGLLPSGFAVGENGLAGLTTVNSSTVVVALVAGIAGILAIETRASAGVGVAISVTTIPASAYLGVAAGVGELDKASGALLVLGINVAMLLARRQPHAAGPAGDHASSASVIANAARYSAPAASSGSSGPPSTSALVGAVIGSKAITSSSSGAKTCA